MEDLTQEVAALRDKVEPAWGPARSEIAYRELGRARRRRRMRYASAVASIAALGLVICSAYVLPRVGFEHDNETASAAAPVPASTHESNGAVAYAAVASGAAERPADMEWRSLNQSGDYESAYRMIEAGAPVADEPEALMEAADVARLAEHPDAAVSYLQKVVSRHRASPITPLAAFTLGRVLLEHLGRPAEAAGAFALARELAPHGSLAQAALAREVESWSKAGQANEADARSRLFVHLYPASRRLSPR